jgi:hypothetical protein
MLIPYPIWLEMGQKVVVDGEVYFGLLSAVKEGRDHFREMTWCCWCPRSG